MIQYLIEYNYAFMDLNTNLGIYSCYNATFGFSGKNLYVNALMVSFWHGNF